MTAKGWAVLLFIGLIAVGFFMVVFANPVLATWAGILALLGFAGLCVALADRWQLTRRR